MKLRFLVLALGSLAACNEEVKVHVNCVTVATPAVECTVEQTQGKTEVDVCWDFHVQCGNGTVVEAPRACQKVSGGGTAKLTIPGDKLTNLDKCGGTNPTAKVTNLTLNGKPNEL